MTDRAAKESRLVELKAELMGVRGTQTEVYSRIVGYYRSVRNWNAGKRHEYTKRKTYEISQTAYVPSGAQAMQLDFGASPMASAGMPDAAASEPANGVHEAYLLFTRKTCPNCPPVRDYLAASGLRATIIDVDTPDGFEAAKRHNVMATPTAILLGSGGDETARAYTRAQLRAQMATARETVRV